MAVWTIADAFGIYHRIDCQHSERVYKRDGGVWCCNSCGERSTTRKDN